MFRLAIEACLAHTDTNLALGEQLLIDQRVKLVGMVEGRCKAVADEELQWLERSQFLRFAERDRLQSLLTELD